MMTKGAGFIFATVKKRNRLQSQENKSGTFSPECPLIAGGAEPEYQAILVEIWLATQWKHSHFYIGHNIRHKYRISFISTYIALYEECNYNRLVG